MDASFVLDGLYLGSLDSICVTNKLKTLGLTHILTIEARPVARHITKGYDTKFVHAFDMDTQDLLQHLEECITYIDEGRAAGGVIVHCFVGQSRSATVVLAYLMHKMDMTLEDAMATLKCARPMIKPNPGFMTQLELFEAMGNVVDKTNTAYKMYRLENLAAHMQEAHGQVGVPEDMLSADPSLCLAANLGLHYKCRKCRRPLFKATVQLPHQTGKGVAAFDWRSRLTTEELGLAEAETCKQSLFVEPVSWMKDDVMQQTGKLTCPKCRAKLGSFSWFGEHCPCGTWVTPAFHIQPSKVDECRPPRLPTAAGTPRVPGLRAATDPNQAATSETAATDPKQGTSETAATDPKQGTSKTAATDPKQGTSETAATDPKQPATSENCQITGRQGSLLKDMEKLKT